MQANVAGRVRNTKLAERNGLLPLFEAVVNSIDAIHDAERDGNIDIKIDRDPKQLELPLHHPKAIPDIVGFSIVDDGVGFTEKNFQSFNTLDSPEKENRGGKGIGRILWLKAFERAEIESVYHESGAVCERRFSFHRSVQGIDQHSHQTVAAANGKRPQTIVRLIGYRQKYRDSSPKSAEIIARRIVEHCLQFFLFGTAPSIRLHDATIPAPIDLWTVFRENFHIGEPRKFEIGDQVFGITDVFLTGDRDTPHHVNFCAHKRAVLSVKLVDHIPHLTPALLTDSGEYGVYSGFVTGDFLDERVTADRTEFDIDRRGEFPLHGDTTWDDLLDVTMKVVAEHLAPLTAGAKQKAWDRIEAFVQTKEPRYRPLLHFRTHEVGLISGELSDERLELELHKIYEDWKREVISASNLELRRTATARNLPAVRERFLALFSSLQEIAKSELAEYVLQRRVILEFFQKMLGLQEGGTFSREEAIHEILFPRHKTSDEIEYDDHNLWILDERLSFHRYLASDVPLSQLKKEYAVQSERRPDILIFNRPMAFSEQDPGVSSVVVVEFKRPERNEYAEDDNPVDQVLDYVQELRDGRAHRPDGTTIHVAQHVPFYCFIIATLTPKMRRFAQRANLILAPDGEGFFGFNGPSQAYIEVLSYQKVLIDSKRRNKVFFDKLQLPMY
ncbi:MAG TPA: hypothetical protein VFQ45_17955 [Longimicrobium sp.]|nr:hypothetical protein [Longimicrobium sp.]